MRSWGPAAGGKLRALPTASWLSWGRQGLHPGLAGELENFTHSPVQAGVGRREGLAPFSEQCIPQP